MIIAIDFIGLHLGFNNKSIVRPGAVHKWRHHWGGVEHSDCDILIMIILSNCSEEANAFLRHVWLFSFDPNHWISQLIFFLVWPSWSYGLGLSHTWSGQPSRRCKCVCQGCPQVGSRRATRKYRQSETELQPLHRALSCRVGTKTRKYRQSDTGVDGPGTYNHSGRFLCSFRGEQNTFIYLYMFTKSVSFMPYEVCSMYEYKKRKGLERDWELRPLIKYCLKIT